MLLYNFDQDNLARQRKNGKAQESAMTKMIDVWNVNKLSAA